MAENMFSSDGSSRSGDVFSSVTQIPSMEHTGKEPIQAQSQSHSSVQSTGRKEPIQAQSQSHSLVQSTGRLKRDKASAYATLFVDEKGRKTVICNSCQNVTRVGGEIASCKKATSEVCFTISEEEEEGIPLRNVKARTVEEEAERSAIGPLADMNENYLIPRDKELLRTAKEALKKLSKPISWPKKQHSKRK